MPPKRPKRAAAAAPPAARPSKLAKQHRLTAAQEAEIRTAYDLFSAPAGPGPGKGKQPAATVIPTAQVRRALVALSAPARGAEELAEINDALDPEGTGAVAFETFFAVAALKLLTRFDDGDEGDGDEDEGVRGGEREARAAFAMFTRDEGAVRITLAHLRRVARELREEVDEKLLRDMIREANGGEDGQGVGIDEFAEVMRRAGVFS